MTDSSPYDLKPACGLRLHEGPTEYWCGKLHDWRPAASLECQRCKDGKPITTDAYRASLAGAVKSVLVLVLSLFVLSACAAPQTKADAGGTKWEKTTAPAPVVTERAVEELIESADGSKLARKIGERTTAPASVVTERAESKGPSVQGPGAEKARLGPTSAGPEGATSGGLEASWRKVLPPGKEWLLLAIGGVALVAGIVLALKFPVLAIGWPLAAAGAACLGLYFYPWLVLVGAAVWYVGDLWQSRRAVNQVNQVKATAEAASADASRQRRALSVVTKAIANSDASTKAAVKRKVADTIAAGSAIDRAIQEAKST